MTLKIAASAVVLAAALCACGQKDAANAPAAHSPTSAPAAPPAPAWAAGLLGADFTAKFPTGGGACASWIDGVGAKIPGGEQMGGWAFDTAAKAGVERVVIVNPAGKMVGFADGGLNRPDVVKARADVSTPNVGWTANIQGPAEKVTAYGVLKDGKTCRLDPAPS